MKIAFVLTQSLDSPSGLGRYAPLAQELVRLGHQVTVLALHYAWEQLSPKRFVEQGVQVVYAGQMHVRKEGPRKSYYGPGRLLLVSLAATARLARALAQTDADVIHVCKPQPFNVLAARLARRGRPVYYDCDDYEAETNRFGGRWQKRIVQYFEDGIVGDARALTVNTHFTADRYAALGFPAGRIHHIPNGVARERFAAPVEPAALEALRGRLGLAPDAPVVLYVGTLGLLSHPVDLLLQAFQQVQRALPEARLLLVGGGEDYDAVRVMAAELGIGGQTIFAGRVPPEQIPAYLSLATVTVDPVHDDAIARARSPLKVLESLAMGVPAVTGDVGDRRELLGDGAAGVLVPAGEASALAEGLLSLLCDRGLHQQKVAAALAQREHYYWDKLVGRFAAAYESS